MSLMSTLAKVAVGVVVAKGAQSMMKKAGQSQGSQQDDGLFRAPHSPGASDAMTGTPLEGMMDSILGGAQPRTQQQPQSQAGSQGGLGGLGGLLEQLGQQNQGGQRGQSGGLGDLLGGLAGGGAGAGGLGGLLGGLAGALQAGQKSEGSFGDVLNSQFDSTPERAKTPTADQEAAAGLMLSAMIQAAKSDGKFDASEQKKITDKLGDVSRAERDFVNAELQKPVDVRGLARSVPSGMEPQVYMMSVLGVDLDAQEEAQYLHQLATEMDLSKTQVNSIHDQMGVVRIYR